jgi:hypothetical protein
MNRNDIIKLFLSGCSVKFIIEKVFLAEKVKNNKFTKNDAQSYVEMILSIWWRNAD